MGSQTAGTPQRAGLGARFLRHVVPHRYRPSMRQLQSRLTGWIYAGDTVECPCCRGRFRRFRAFEEELRCPRCGSLGRHRLTWLFLTDKKLLAPNARLLHLAPEHSLQLRLAELLGDGYYSADLDSPLAEHHFDLCDVPLPDASFDAVICSHVLEHIPDDRRALAEIFRLLRPGGWAILLVPLEQELERTFEDPSVTTPRARQRVFGQYDHYRVYGRDYPDRVAASGFAVEVHEYAQRLEPPAAQRFGIDPGERIYLCARPREGDGGSAVARRGEAEDAGSGEPQPENPRTGKAPAANHV